MNENEIRHLTRRRFLEKAGLGAGSVALTALLHEQGILSASAPVSYTHLRAHET